MKWEKVWYENSILSLLLLPLSWLFCLVTMTRKWAYTNRLLNTSKLPVPVIIIGNISVGGTGKTPLVIWLVKFLQHKGFKPGVISRGYGGLADHWPQEVTPGSKPEQVGDEAVVIARNIDGPVFVSPDRYEAGKSLLENYDCDIVICDDGLQHYALHRDIEICVIDGKRRHGNGYCLPAGPLREPKSRLKSVDAIINNGTDIVGEFSMRIKPIQMNQISGNITKSIETFKNATVHAIAGTGNPDRFFEALREQGLKIIEHPFDDHHNFTSSEINFRDRKAVIMTEKDAVKCQDIADENHWYLSIEAKLPEIFERRLQNLLKIEREHESNG